jgi:hypothetical protein
LPSDVAQLIHAHPTQNEAVGEAHLALAGSHFTPTPNRVDASHHRCHLLDRSRVT